VNSSQSLHISPLALEEESDEEQKVLVSVDFGTTHTAVAYIILEAVRFLLSLTETLASAKGVEAIHKIIRWP
jgi:molecular chaperone DnaK (HSP70)